MASYSQGDFRASDNHKPVISCQSRPDFHELLWQAFSLPASMHSVVYTYCMPTSKGPLSWQSRTVNGIGIAQRSSTIALGRGIPVAGIKPGGGGSLWGSRISVP